MEVDIEDTKVKLKVERHVKIGIEFGLTLIHLAIVTVISMNLLMDKVLQL